MHRVKAETTRKLEKLSTPFHILHHLLVCATTVNVSVTLTNIGFTEKRQRIPTSPHVKKPRSGNISAGSLSKQRQICTWPRLWFGGKAAEKLRTDVFGVPPPTPLSHFPCDRLFPSFLVPVSLIWESLCLG